jgi:hypothetical protein
MGGIRWFEDVLQFSSTEEGDLEQLEHLLEAEGDAGLELESGQEEIGGHGHIDLTQNGVLRGPL